MSWLSTNVLFYLSQSRSWLKMMSSDTKFSSHLLFLPRFGRFSVYSFQSNHSLPASLHSGPNLPPVVWLEALYLLLGPFIDKDYKGTSTRGSRLSLYHRLITSIITANRCFLNLIKKFSIACACFSMSNLCKSIFNREAWVIKCWEC